MHISLVLLSRVMHEMWVCLNNRHGFRELHVYHLRNIGTSCVHIMFIIGFHSVPQMKCPSQWQHTGEAKLSMFLLTIALRQSSCSLRLSSVTHHWWMHGTVLASAIGRVESWTKHNTALLVQLTE